MINPNKPFNDLPLIPPKFDCDDIEILKLVNKANLALSKLHGQTSAKFNHFQNAMLLAEIFTVREAVDSSRVENIATTVKDALRARALPEPMLSPEEKETNRYSVATYEGFKRLKKKGILATNDYIEIQRKLALPESDIRKIPGYAIADKNKGKIYYTPPEGEKLIRDLLKNLEDYFNDTNEDPDPLIKMAILHYQFEAIHPFPDGNGRTGRILMTLYLIAHKRLDLPALFLSDYILNHRDEYYTKLRAVTYKDAWGDWIKYILTAVYEQASKTTLAIDKINIAKTRFERDIPQSIPHARRTDLVNFLFTAVAFNAGQLAKNLEVHPNTASAYLKILVDSKQIDVRKHKNSKVFYVPTFIEILAQ